MEGSPTSTRTGFAQTHINRASGMGGDYARFAQIG